VRPEATSFILKLNPVLQLIFLEGEGWPGRGWPACSDGGAGSCIPRRIQGTDRFRHVLEPYLGRVVGSEGRESIGSAVEQLHDHKACSGAIAV
jgi:hypothetical protein